MVTLVVRDRVCMQLGVLVTNGICLSAARLLQQSRATLPTGLLLHKLLYAFIVVSVDIISNVMSKPYFLSTLS